VRLVALTTNEHLPLQKLNTVAGITFAVDSAFAVSCKSSNHANPDSDNASPLCKHKSSVCAPL
jgi:hypothetical protein